jgi:hypothetical protein
LAGVGGGGIVVGWPMLDPGGGGGIIGADPEEGYDNGGGIGVIDDGGGP